MCKQWSHVGWKLDCFKLCQKMQHADAEAIESFKKKISQREYIRQRWAGLEWEETIELKMRDLVKKVKANWMNVGED